MNKQDIFNKVYLGLKSQDFKKALGKITYENGTTLNLYEYRTKEGLKCAAGHLIPDELYDRSIENKTFEQLHAIHDELKLNSDAVDFVKELQLIHDKSLSPNKLRRNLTQFAKEYNLEKV